LQHPRIIAGLAALDLVGIFGDLWQESFSAGSRALEASKKASQQASRQASKQATVGRRALEDRKPGLFWWL
jgi:hypothetical protein